MFYSRMYQTEKKFIVYIFSLIKVLRLDALNCNSCLNLYKTCVFSNRCLRGTLIKFGPTLVSEMKPPPPPPYSRLTPPRVKLPPSKLLLNRFPASTTRHQPSDERVQPGKDCEYFTHSVCLEVSNYPT